MYVTLRLQLHNQTHTEQVAAAFAQLLIKLAQVNQHQAQLVYLLGNLGAGKSTFTRGLIHSLGFTQAIPSPTYSLIETYNFHDLTSQGFASDKLTVHHCDLYRLGSFEEFDYIGGNELFEDDSVTLVEWPDELTDYYQPNFYLQFYPTTDEDERELYVAWAPTAQLGKLHNPAVVSQQQAELVLNFVKQLQNIVNDNCSDNLQLVLDSSPFSEPAVISFSKSLEEQLQLPTINREQVIALQPEFAFYDPQHLKYLSQ